MTDTAPSANNPALTILRGFIVVAAAFALYSFTDGMPLALGVLAEGGLTGIDALFALATGVAGPLCALAAGALAIMNRRLGLACILLVAAPLIYWSPVIAFAISVMIYGF